MKISKCDLCLSNYS